MDNTANSEDSYESSPDKASSPSLSALTDIVQHLYKESDGSDDENPPFQTQKHCQNMAGYDRYKSSSSQHPTQGLDEEEAPLQDFIPSPKKVEENSKVDNMLRHDVSSNKGILT